VDSSFKLRRVHGRNLCKTYLSNRKWQGGAMVVVYFRRRKTLFQLKQVI
jgi:hypothetical protein